MSTKRYEGCNFHKTKRLSEKNNTQGDDKMAEEEESL